VICCYSSKKKADFFKICNLTSLLLSSQSELLSLSFWENRFELFSAFPAQRHSRWWADNFFREVIDSPQIAEHFCSMLFWGFRRCFFLGLGGKFSCGKDHLFSAEVCWLVQSESWTVRSGWQLFVNFRTVSSGGKG
jgi:hypothetical protein